MARIIGDMSFTNHAAWCELVGLETDIEQACSMLLLIGRAQDDLFKLEQADDTECAITALREAAQMFLIRAQERLPRLLAHTDGAK